MIHLVKALRPLAKYFLIALTLSIITVSSLSYLPTPKFNTGKIEIRLDYIIHILEYGGLSFFAFLTFTRQDFHINSKNYLVITLSLLVFCVLDEFHQKVIPGRTFNPNDILSNITGVLGGLGFCVIVFRKIHVKDF
jgi:VanZ family protein